MNGADGRVGLQHALRSDLEDNQLADGGESLTKSNSHLVRKCTKVRHFLEDLTEVSHSQDSLSSHFKTSRVKEIQILNTEKFNFIKKQAEEITNFHKKLQEEFEKSISNPEIGNEEFKTETHLISNFQKHISDLKKWELFRLLEEGSPDSQILNLDILDLIGKKLHLPPLKKLGEIIPCYNHIFNPSSKEEIQDSSITIAAGHYAFKIIFHFTSLHTGIGLTCGNHFKPQVEKKKRCLRLDYSLKA
ncbi:hypothetical protein PGTUg99_011929 [Puccinia graminis f. sp. tritici]|uniref:Uncharacterized protein n=1 Tax=Puccinia graminis f. sp. tritici TaxID=56615 RepID=A0A5B0RIN5_PUCGR|nr:hypothetical protein PGTUg99_011929 [Puccinia graminis f. sp. tritici]